MCTALIAWKFHHAANAVVSMMIVNVMGRMTMSKTKREFVSELGDRAHGVKLVANNTCEYTDVNTEDRVIRHFETDILRFTRNGSIVFNTGGHNTVTTRKRLNDMQPHVTFFTKSFVLYATDGKRIVVARDGMWWHPTKGFKNVGKLPNKNLIRSIRKYANDFANALPAEPPNSGDCWYCLYNLSNDSTHLINHVKEKYYVSALLVNAMKEAGASSMIIACAFLPNENAYSYHRQLLDSYRKQIAKWIFKYMYRRIIDGMSTPRHATTGFAV